MGDDAGGNFTNDSNKLLMSNSKVINLNINYNSKNNLNAFDNNNISSNIFPNNLNNFDNLNNDYTKINTKSNDSTRIYTNSNWIYGNKAWTNNPDFYIPPKDNIKKEKLLTNNYF